MFGGLFIPGPSMPVYWRWANIMSPIRFAVESLVAPQYHRDDCTPYVTCPTLTVFTGSSFAVVDRGTFVESYYGIRVRAVGRGRGRMGGGRRTDGERG